MSLSTGLGVIVGVFMAPLMATAAAVRRARVFHPVGLYYVGKAVRRSDGPMAARLEGPVLARFSSGLARRIGDDVRDLIGLTLRFHEEGADPRVASDGDQDLIMASFPTISKLRACVGTTDTRNLTANQYWSATSFSDRDAGLVTFRATPKKADAIGADAGERYDQVVRAGNATILLEVRPARGGEWEPLVEIALADRIEAADAKTSFYLFRDGRGIRAEGFVQGIRKVAYAVSKRVRGVEPT